MRPDVLVTGSSGQLGSSLVDSFRDAGLTVVGADVRPSRWTTHVVDLRTGKVPEARRIIHCAAQVSVQTSLRDPVADAEHNILATLRVLEAAKETNAQSVLYVSSAAAYGTPTVVPIRETHPLCPLSPYGLSKLAGEQYALLAHRNQCLPVTCVRPFNIYSARQDPTNPYSGVITQFAKRLRAGESPIVRGNGSQTRDFVHVDDVVRAIQLLIDSPDAIGRVFNVGTGTQVSIHDLAVKMMRVAGQSGEPQSAPALDAEIPHSVADITALRRLGFVPRVGLERGLREILAPAVTTYA